MPRRIAPAAVLAACLVAPLALGDVVISGAWVRAMPPTQSMTAGYLTLENRGTTARTVTGASSSASPRVEIHTTVVRDGMQRMQPAGDLALAPGDRIDMAPGGYHLMLRDMPRMPVEGDSVELCLEFARGRPVCTQATVSRGDATADSHQHH